jgi:UDP-N-acetyl-D-glucosamine dehydrogenase
VAFKKNVDDTRHAPAHTVIRLLREKGIEHIRYADPHVERFSVETNEGTRSEESRVEIPRVGCTAEELSGHDVVVLLTDHDAFPYERIARHARSIVDTRNGMQGVTGMQDGRREGTAPGMANGTTSGERNGRADGQNDDGPGALWLLGGGVEKCS